MTCVSLRSGIASSGTVFSAQTPVTTATVTSRITTKRFFAEDSMIALITAMSLVRRWRRRLRGSCRRAGRWHVWHSGHTRRRCAECGAVLMLWGAHPAGRRFELAFRINQEGARGDDTLAGRQPVCHRDAIAEAFADGDLARLKIAMAEIDEHGLPITGVEDRVGRHGQLRSAGDAEFDVDEHLGLHPQPRIIRVEPNFKRARHRIDLRLDVVHLRGD